MAEENTKSIWYRILSIISFGVPINRFESIDEWWILWASTWLRLFGDIVGIATFSLWYPDWSFNFVIKKRTKRLKKKLKNTGGKQ